MSQEASAFSSEYSEDSFWAKISKFAASAGKEVALVALKLYYAYQRPETPAKAKAIIMGALAYFILPIDAIADVLPVIGFTDDLGVLAAALTAVAIYIDDDVITKADAQLKHWFG